jgi:hypothetical protein
MPPKEPRQQPGGKPFLEFLAAVPVGATILVEVGATILGISVLVTLIREPSWKR